MREENLRMSAWVELDALIAIVVREIERPSLNGQNQVMYCNMGKSGSAHLAVLTCL